MNLRPYQQEAARQCNTLLNANRHPINVAPTGTGKTVTGISIIADRVRLGQRVFILTPQEEIFNQWAIGLHQANIPTGYINSNGVQGRNKDVYICMPLSLNNILSLLPERFKPDIIVTDECQHSRATTWENIYSFFSDAVRLGLTATPQRGDGKGLDNLYTDIVQTITMREAIVAGYLSQPLIAVPEIYKIKCRIQNGDFDIQEQAEQLGTVKIIGNVIEQYGNIFNGLPILCACSTHEHAKMMTEAFNAAGWFFEHIHSNLNIHERRGMLKRIRRNESNGLCTVGIGIEGLDIPGLFGLIWLRRTLSITVYLQFIGRVLRPFPGKHFGIIIDPVGNAFIHGTPELDREWKLTGRDEEPNIDLISPKMKICPMCTVMNAEQNIACHICGYDFISGELSVQKNRKLPAMVDGRFVMLNDDELSARKEEIKEKLREQRERKKTEEKKPDIQLSRIEKIDILKNGLERKSGLFQEAIKNYL